MLRLSWTQPEDLVPHALAAAELDGVDVSELRREWVAAGGSPVAAVSGASPVPASAELRALARVLLARIDELPLPAALVEAEPNGFAAILDLAPQPPELPVPARVVGDRVLGDRMLGAWLGRAAGCLLGKPVEKISREGIRAIAESTGNWPVSSYFTERGLDPAVAAQYPWNRRSRPTSLVENIDGMPEDDDLNFPLIALDLLERTGADFGTDDVALSWLANLPGGRVFTAERIAYRNLLEGHEPDVAAGVQNPFQEWIGAQIRTDVYGWARPGDPHAAAALAYRDAWLSHRRSGLYGALFVAAASSAALVASSVHDVIAAGLSAVPEGSRYAAAIVRGAELGASGLSTDEALDALAAEYGHLHWVHALSNSALLAFALVRSDGDFATAISIAVMGGWDTDSVGATAGAITGALTGAASLPPAWIDPLHNRLATSIPGFDSIGFDELAARTAALVPSLASTLEEAAR
jgi:ADP-ribosylglycohydrolase